VDVYIKSIIVNCDLTVSHTNLFSEAYYFFEEIKNNNNNNNNTDLSRWLNLIFRKLIRYLACNLLFFYYYYSQDK